MPQAFGLREVTSEASDGTPVLRGATWSLEQGAVGLIVGVSGAGKSRLLRILNRLDEPTAGTVEILGQSLHAWPLRELRRRVAWVPQRPALGRGRVADALSVPVALGLIERGELEQRRPEALAIAAVSDELLARRVSELSGGELHRIALARALLFAPQMLLLDEPSAALDGQLAHAVLAAVGSWAKRLGTTLVVATHRIEDLHTLGGTVAVVDAGRVVRCGSTSALLADATGYDVHRLLTGRQAS